MRTVNDRANLQKMNLEESNAVKERESGQLNAMREDLRKACEKGELDKIVSAAQRDPENFDIIFGWRDMHKELKNTTPRQEVLRGRPMQAMIILLSEKPNVISAYQMLLEGDDEVVLFLRRYCEQLLADGPARSLLEDAANVALPSSYLSMVLALRTNMQSVVKGNLSLAHRFLCGSVLVSLIRLRDAGADTILLDTVFGLVAKKTRIFKETFCENESDKVSRPRYF